MWAALKSDLSEFVSTVSSESTQALASVDNALTSLDRNGESSNGSDDEGQESQSEEEENLAQNLETSMEEKATPSKYLKKEAERSNNPDIVDGEMGLISGSDEGFESTGIIATADDEVARLRTQENTYIIDLPDTDEVNEFLAGMDFSSEDLNEEINRTLKAHPGTVQKFYEALVVQPISDGVDEDDGETILVTHEQFWTRYFYRCNADRVERQWALEKEERAQARKAAAEALAKGAKQGWGMARNFVGNAMKVVAPVFEAEQSNETASGIVQSFVDGNGGRPPFVLRPTDSSEREDDEADEEEELGWDDDDDEDIEDDVDTTTESEEIVFDSSGSGTPTRSHEEADAANKEIEHLRMAVFEKDAELAALRAKLEDTEDNDNKRVGNEESSSRNKEEIEAMKQEIQVLKTNLEVKNAELASYKEKVSILTKAEETSNDESSESIESLRSKLILAEQSLSDAKVAEQANQTRHEREIENLNEKLTNALQGKAEADRQLLEHERNLEKTQNVLAQMQEEVTAVQNELATKSEDIVNLKGELKFTQSLAQHAERLEVENAQLRKELHPSNQQGSFVEDSPNSSLSSAVKVDTPDESAPAMCPPNLSSSDARETPMHVPASSGEKSGGDEEDSDWGDDGWGDGLEDL